MHEVPLDDKRRILTSLREAETISENNTYGYEAYYRTRSG